jgi:hypothetical protein
VEAFLAQLCGCVFRGSRHPEQVTRVIMALLGSFGVVLLLAVTFAVIYRRHARQLRRRNRSVDQLSYIASSRRRLLAYPLPARWVLVRTSNTSLLRSILGVTDDPQPHWGDALSRIRERRLFVSAPVDGWTLVIGAGIPDPVTDVDQTYRFLVDLSRDIGEVQFYQVDRVLNFHAWARLREGRVARGYVWAGQTLWNEGRMTLEERLLGMRCRDYGVDPEPLHYGEIPPEQVNAERVPLLARRWGMDLATVCEVLLAQERVESGDDLGDHS